MKTRPVGAFLLRAVGRTDKYDEADIPLSQSWKSASQLRIQNDVTSSLQTTLYLLCLYVHCWIINIVVPVQGGTTSNKHLESIKISCMQFSRNLPR